jgi:hypothetical protein
MTANLERGAPASGATRTGAESKRFTIHSSGLRLANDHYRLRRACQTGARLGLHWGAMLRSCAPSTAEGLVMGLAQLAYEVGGTAS